MIQKRYFQNALIGGIAAIFGGSQVIPGSNANGPVLSSAIAIVTGDTAAPRQLPADSSTASSSTGTSKVAKALEAFRGVVRPLSHSRALEDAFTSYFAYKSAHPAEVKKPYLYFVDYGLSNKTPRGYVFDMDSYRIVDGPFMVAHGRGSRERGGVPTRFSNTPNSYATSLGLYVAQETYTFRGKANGRTYKSVGLKLEGVSEGFNDNARERKVVAHGAPYVTATKAGRSEGCPAIEQSRAKRLLPQLANGAMVFLFAPNETWMESDPWVTADAE